MPQAYALKFISGKYQGGEFPLPPDREILIGRSSDLDMVLVEDMVSRKHAKISTDAGQIVIVDLGSTNGTFVNGEKIRKARLKESDRILIGTSILKVVGTATPMSTDLAKQKLEAVGQKASQGTTMSGTLEEVPVPDLLQLFSTSKRTGLLEVRSGSSEGKVYLRNGNIYYAVVDENHSMGPMKALCRVVAWDRGTFNFGPKDADAEFMIELEDTTENLLMKALHQLDEFRRIAPELPDPATAVSVPHPLEPRLADLEPLELEMFQLAYNFGTTGRALDASTGTDFESGRALLQLFAKGYLTERR